MQLQCKASVSNQAAEDKLLLLNCGCFESNMMLGMSSRVAWICLLFSSGACFPATKEDYRYPYAATWSSSGDSGSSNLQPGGSRRPLVSLLHEPSVNEAAPQQPGSPSGNQSPSSVAAVSSPSYEPNSFIVNYDPAGVPEVPSQSAGYDSPPVGPSFFRQPDSGATGSYESASSPAYEASFAPAAPVEYPADTYSPPASEYDSPIVYDNAPGPLSFYPSPVAYENPSSGGSPSRDEQPTGGADVSFYDPSHWMVPSSFPDFSALDSESTMPESVSETSPLPPSSYIIQSRNGYQREREFFSHSKYSPEYLPPPVPVNNAPSKSPAWTPSKGAEVN